MPTWPPWWEWPIELSPHLIKRMADRRFDEIDLRAMIEDAGGYREDVVEGRWLLETKHGGKGWEVIVEPEDERKLLVVVTAYPIE